MAECARKVDINRIKVTKTDKKLDGNRNVNIYFCLSFQLHKI